MGNKNDDSLERFIKNLKEIPYIGELTARVLVKNGYDSLSKIEDADLEELIQIDSIGEDKANRILEEIKGEKEDSKNITSEFFCPTCRSIIELDMDICEECDEEFKIEGAVILPDVGLVDEPKKLLASSERDIMDGKESSEVWYGRGAVLESMGFKWEALRSYNKVIEHDPLYDHIWNTKARAALEVGQVKDAARAYKIAFDTHIANSKIKSLSHVEPSIEKEKKVIEKRDISVKEVENKIFMARSVISELKRNEIDLSDLKNLLDSAVEARNNDNRKESVNKSERIINSAGQIREFLDIKEKIDEHLEKLEGLDIDTEDYISKEEALIEEINDGNYESTIEDSYPLLDTVQQRLEDEKVRIEKEKERKEKIDENIQDIKKLVKELRKTSLDLDEFKNNLSEVIQARKEERYKEGLDKVSDILETGEVILETDKKIKDIKEKISESEFTLKEFGFKEEIQKILDLAKDGLYTEAKEKSTSLLEKYDDRLVELEQEKDLKEKFSEKVSDLKEKFSELKNTSLNEEIIKSKMADAKELKSQEEYGDGINVLDEAIDDTNKLLDFSERLEEAKSVIKQANEQNIEIKDYKVRLKSLKNDAEDGSFENIFDDIEELIEDVEDTIEETITERKHNLEDKIDELDEVIKEGKEKNVAMEAIQEKLDKAVNMKKEENYLDGLNILKGTIEKAQTKIELDPKLSSIDEIIGEIKEDIDVSKFEEQISKIRNRFDEGDYEESLTMSEALHEEIIERKKQLEKEHELSKIYEEKLSEARDILSKGRDTRVKVDDIKKLIDEAEDAKEEKDYEEAINKLDRSMEDGQRVLDIFGMIKEGAEKIEKMKEYDLDYKEYLEHLRDCKKMADINIYDKAEMILENALEDMDEELIEIEEESLTDVAEESKAEIKAMEEELSRSYEKLRNDVDDLKDLYMVADDFDIQVGIGRKLLKITIKNIREGDYKKATKHLEKGEDKILESIEERIDEMLHNVESKLTKVEEEKKIEDAENLIDEVEDSRENGEYRESLEKLHEIKDMLKDIKEFDIDEKISSLEELVNDAEEAGLEVEEYIESNEKLREMEDEQDDNIEEEIISTEEEVKDEIKVKIEDEIENLREELEDMDLEDSQISKPSNLLSEAELAKEEGNLKKALSTIIDYNDMLEEGLEDSED